MKKISSFILTICFFVMLSLPSFYIPISKFQEKSSKEKELVYVHKIIYNGDIQPSKEELDGGRFWSRDEILSNIGKNIFTPNFENEYTKFFK